MNYSMIGRTNYFPVNDIDLFKSECAVIGLTPYHHDENSELVCLLADEGFPTTYWDEEETDDFPLDIAGFIADHIREGSVAILQEIGWEGMRFVTGWALAVNSAFEVKSISLDNIYELADTMGEVHTQAAY